MACEKVDDSVLRKMQGVSPPTGRRVTGEEAVESGFPLIHLIFKMTQWLRVLGKTLKYIFYISFICK